jgi:hypothetical protein
VVGICGRARRRTIRAAERGRSAPEVWRKGDAPTTRDRAYLDLLHQGLVFLRATRCGRLEIAAMEAEHLHEVPTLIGSAGEGRRLYYLRGTRAL